MRGTTACALLIACTVLFQPPSAAGEKPVRRMEPARRSPNTAGRATRARYTPPTPAKPRNMTSSVGASRRPDAQITPDWPQSAGPARHHAKPAPAKPEPPRDHPADSSGETAVALTIESDGCKTNPADVDADAFLLPVLHPGHWAMPPGGLTRFLWRPRTLVNPDQSLPSGPVVANSG